MRKIFLALITILAFTSYSRAQTPKPDNGIKGGLTSARFQNSPFETRSAMGFVLGVYMDFEISTNFSVSTEIFYTEKGSKIYAPSYDTEFDLNLDYVEVPMMVNYRLPSESIFQPRIFAGPYASFLINSSASVTIADEIASTPDDFVEDANDLDWGGVLGVGMDANFSFRKITFEVRYSAGLSNAFNNSIPGNYKNGVLSILFGFSL